MRHKAHRTVAAAGVGAGIFLFSGLMVSCSSSAQGTSSTPAPVAASMVMSMPGPDQRDAKGIKGSLEDDEKVTQNYWLTLGWGDDFPDSAAWEGEFGGSDVRIRIVPAVTSPQVTWSKALSGDPSVYAGHIVMKIIVLEDRAVPELGLKGLDIGYLWIGQRGRGNSDGLGAAIYTIKPNGKAHKEKNMEITGFCKEDHGGRAMAYVRADDKCRDPLPPPTAASSSAFRPVPFKTRAGPIALPLGQGLWVTCTGGCCEVKPTGT